MVLWRGDGSAGNRAPWIQIIVNVSNLILEHYWIIKRKHCANKWFHIIPLNLFEKILLWWDIVCPCRSIQEHSGLCLSADSCTHRPTAVVLLFEGWHLSEGVLWFKVFLCWSCQCGLRRFVCLAAVMAGSNPERRRVGTTEKSTLFPLM